MSNNFFYCVRLREYDIFENTIVFAFLQGKLSFVLPGSVILFEAWLQALLEMSRIILLLNSKMPGVFREFFLLWLVRTSTSPCPVSFQNVCSVHNSPVTVL